MTYVYILVIYTFTNSGMLKDPILAYANLEDCLYAAKTYNDNSKGVPLAVCSDFKINQ
ncbi:hypothetical protein [Ferrovum sp.]|uniref:hypothetical protein n=1 Tax=Ferrovum sp. TaxID=2609467 RepID=UPI0026090331|nr:hypothetical protein [Ferrovum sp.]